MELELLPTQERWVDREDAQPLVFPPDVLRAILVMRDPQAAASFARLQAPVAEQRSEDHLDLHRIRHDTAENALWMLPHATNIGTGLPS